MSNLLDGKTFGDRLYNSLPKMYHTEDSSVNYALKRYLQAMVEGGFSYVINESNGILDLNDPARTPSEVLPIIFEQYGLSIFNGIPETYLRKLLPILKDLYDRKGATTVIEYLTSIISDVEAEVIVSPNFKEDFHIDLRLEMDYDQEDVPDKDQLIRIIKEFLPFFIEVTIILVYLFYEYANIKVKEDFHDFIKENRAEESSFYSVGFPYEDSSLFGYCLFGSGVFDKEGFKWYTDYYFDKVKYLTDEKAGISSDDSFIETLFKLFSEEKTSISKDADKDIIITLIDTDPENIGFYKTALPTYGTSLFGEAVFGEAIFNKDSDSKTEIHEDYIKVTLDESSSIECEDYYEDTIIKL